MVAGGASGGRGFEVGGWGTLAMAMRIVFLCLALTLLAGCDLDLRRIADWGIGTAESESPPPSPGPGAADRVQPSAKVALTANETRYDVTGQTSAQLRADLDRLGPRDRSGKRYDAHTTWNIAWAYRFVRGVRGCRASFVTATVDVRQTLPRWRERAGASAPLVQRWQTYELALQEHEDGHRDIAVRAANAAHRALTELPAAPNCDEMDRRANAAGQAILEQHRQQERDYDRTTKHGVTQGAVFPAR
jgi:predicted secreted Zn-dependent protease